MRKFVVSAIVLLLGRGRARPAKHPAPKSPGAETAVLALLGIASLLATGFIVIYAVNGIPHETQLLGVCIGLSLLAIAAALVVVGKRLVDTEEIGEPYPQEDPEEQELVAQIIEEGGDRISRRRLFKLGLLGAGGTLGLAAITPALSFGPLFQTKYFRGTPWRRGTRLVDESSRPYRASEIEEGSFYTAFPEGTSTGAREDLGAPLVLVRLPKKQLRLPAELAGYDADGIVAYSKICTHAGCAISMYRTPLFQPDEPRPALVCPCHYSTFDPADGGSVLFGPAGRRLPMLPLEIDGKGYLRAKGNFDDQVGPTWWGTHIWRPNP